MVIEFRTASTPDTLLATRNLSEVPTEKAIISIGEKNYRVSSWQWILKDSGTTKVIVRIF